MFQIIANNSKSLQDAKQPPWVFVKKYDCAVRKLNKMVNDLRTRTTPRKMFQEFPDLHYRLSIFTQGVEIFKTTDAQGVIKNNEFLLGDALPSWDSDSHPEWLDEDDWTDQSESESESDTNIPPKARRKRKKNGVQGRS